jgi:hypothetical protein
MVGGYRAGEHSGRSTLIAGGRLALKADGISSGEKKLLDALRGEQPD